MGQKIHPLGFRLGITQKHSSKWFARPKNYSKLLLEDTRLREFILKKYANAHIMNIYIQRHQAIKPPGKNQKIAWQVLEVTIHTPVPEQLSENHQTMEQAMKQLRTECEAIFATQRQIDGDPKLSVIPHVHYVTNPFTNASIIADLIIEQLEKRTNFRTALKTGLTKAKEAKQHGVKIQLSGRLNGAEMARTESVRHGRVPLHTLRANIDYCYKTAKTIYGILGIKVWIFKTT